MSEPVTFPSLEWMQAYAATIAAHEQADHVATALEGRYRFVIVAGRDLDRTHCYDLTVDPAAGFGAVEGEKGDTAGIVLTAKADYARWKALLTGKADFVMSFLMRKVTIEGDLGAVREQLRDAKPLLDSLTQVPTTFSR